MATFGWSDDFNRVDENPLGTRIVDGYPQPNTEWETVGSAPGVSKPILQSNVVWRSTLAITGALWNLVPMAEDCTVFIDLTGYLGVGKGGSVGAAVRCQEPPTALFNMYFCFIVRGGGPAGVDQIQIAKYISGGVSNIGTAYNLPTNETENGRIGISCVQEDTTTVRLRGFWNGAQVINTTTTSDLRGGQPGFYMSHGTQVFDDLTQFQPRGDNWTVSGELRGPEGVSKTYLDP